ncbi:protogenin isoform X2 [Cryptotermes secundus]|uniref:protogenin isoform X2 n=1 Tax=Cryptotermes secundus TaxID=105785 RepID=UPI001454DF03|nr:protogenin isoform X2 [Cryptotermes secundus]
MGVAGLDVTLEFTREPQDVVAVRSKPLVLQCAVSNSAPGPVNITWTHEGEPLPLVNDSRRYLLPNGSLYFRKVLWKRGGPQQEGPTDQGLYRCMARNSVGALVSRSAHLRVATLSHDFSQTPYNTTTEEDDIARFMCQIESVPKAMVSWERNGKPLPHNSRYFTLDSGVLYITKVQHSDAGTYRCVATNLLTKKSRYSSEGHLEVVPKSPFIRLPQFISVSSAMIETHAGANVTLDCAATGLPIPELTWTFLPRVPDGKLHPITNTSRNGLNVVTLHHVTPGQTGTYTCTASVAHDKLITPITQMVLLEVLEAPLFIKVPTSQVYLTAKTVRFECDVKDNRTTEIVWLKDGKQLQINGRIKQRPSELVLSNTVTDDSGLYQCLAYNRVGESWVAGRLLVNMSRIQPEPPQGLTCYTLSDSAVRLECKEPAKPQNNITAYTIHYLPTDGGEERQEVSINCSFLVHKLSAFTNYTFYVRAYSSKSASDQSKRTKCQTGEGVPQAAPQLSLKATSPISLRAMWMPLSKEKAQGVVTEYKIQWRRKGQASSRVEQLRGDVTDYTITGLHPGKKYQVRVLAATSKGWPIQADEFEWQDLEMPSYGSQHVPQAPTVHLTVVNATSIEVTWSMSSEDMYKPDGFILYYRKMSNEKFGPISLASNTTQYLLGNLEPDCWYEVTVQGYNNEGVGDLGLKAIHTLPARGSTDGTSNPFLGLEPPTNLEAEPTSPTSINLTWTSSQSTMNVSYYTVCYGLVQSTRTVNTSVYSYVSSTSQGVEVTGLTPYTLYEFKVRSHDHNNQYGPYSQKVECHTLEDVPSAVLDVQWSPLNSSTVRISWKEPQRSNGVIKNYELLVRGYAGSQHSVHCVNVSNSKLNTEVTDLEPNTRYLVTVRAVTRAGMGPPSASVTVTIPVVPPPGIPASVRPPSTHNPKTDQHLGIVVGVAIGVGFIILCAMAVMWRRRCMKSASAECSSTATTCGGHQVNGNGYYKEWDRSATGHGRIMAAPSESHELDYFVTAVTTNIPCDDNTDHLDTKGGYPNGQVNGLMHPLLTNGRIPNGQVSRDWCNVRIIENPQFTHGESVDSQQRLLLPVKTHTSHMQSDRRSGAGEEEVQLLSEHHVPLITLRGEEVPLQREASHGVAADSSSNVWDGTEDTSSADIRVSDLPINSTQVTDMDVSSDGGILHGRGNQSSQQKQEQHSQQHSPHHHHHHPHQQHQNNSSYNSHSQGSTSLHHIDHITGTTATRSQFHPPLVQKSSSATTVTPQAELLHPTASP